MNDMVSKIDELIKYLIRVFNGTELTSESKKEQEKYGDYTKEDEIVRSQDFFILTEDLDKILEPWFGGFKNDEELNNNYSHLIHSHLIKVFEERIGIKKVKENKRITIRDKKVYDLVKALNLKIDFLREDSLSKYFVDILIGKSDKNICLNIDNGSFHYILTRLKSFFYNLSITSVANTNKIYSSKGSILKVKNLNNSKSHDPKHKDAIDEVFKNFQ